HLLRENIVSSTAIRTALKEGKTEEANELLGYTFFFDGRVVEGRKLGRTLGYPTANLTIEDHEKVIPANGVYAVRALLLSNDADLEPLQLLKGMMNIGVRPTVDGLDKVIEVNLFDFNTVVYGRKLRVFVHKFLRAEIKFASIDLLKEQLKADEIAAKTLLNSMA
ncbi:MAG: riboflavin biosynthesis protein RibF, partial [Chitinophagaceae bacterium]|nr:riboflavin biosynthesis protein RibF [Chitinophagaceae bacterium]